MSGRELLANHAPTTFAEFWPHYLRAHQNATSRLLHYLGTFGTMLCWALFGLTLDWTWLVAAVIVPYSFAWAGHFFVENNTPLAFSKPLWSLMADFRMFGLALSGRLMRQMDQAVADAA
jgi:hypothetical protein